MSGKQPAIAVDVKKAYQEVGLGALNAQLHNSKRLPYRSDWAIAVGDFGS